MKLTSVLILYILSQNATAQLTDNPAKIKGACSSNSDINFEIYGRDPILHYGVFAEGLSNQDLTKQGIRVYAQYDIVTVQAGSSSNSFTVQSLDSGTLIKFSFYAPKVKEDQPHNMINCQLQILENPYKNWANDGIKINSTN